MDIGSLRKEQDAYDAECFQDGGIGSVSKGHNR